jgi:flagellar FliJ protein
MSRFSFRLQRVLDLRERREREMAIVLAMAQREAAEARRAHEELESACLDGNDHIAGTISGDATATAGELQYLSVVLDHLRIQARAADDVRVQAESRVEQSTDAVAAAARARQVLERLRSEQHSEWQSGELQAEQKSMDAIALSRYVLRVTRAVEK